jgi:dinuclear metal center YbgI/SA1388 family protein
MTIRDVLTAIDAIAPFSLAEPWDNTGLLLGSPQTNVIKLLAALDVTLPVIEEAKSLGVNLIVTHHPVIFSPLKSVPGDSIPWRLIESGISVICAHTNLDKAEGGVNDTLASALGLTGVRPLPEPHFGRAAELPKSMTPRELAAHVAETLGSPAVKYSDPGIKIETVALCGGAGAEAVYALPAEARAFITGEIKHHIWLDAARLGVCLIEAGHFHTENVIIPVLAARLRELLPEIEVVVSSRCTDGVLAVRG